MYTHKSQEDVDKNFLSSIDFELKYINSGSFGHVFKAMSNDDDKITFAIKMCAHPGHVEPRVLNLFRHFVTERTIPHIVLPFGQFRTSITSKIPYIINDRNYKEFLDEYSVGKYENDVSVLICEWYKGGDLLDYIRKNYLLMTLEYWTVILFQIIYTLAKIQEYYPTFRHNCLKVNDILLQTTDIHHQHTCYLLGKVKFCMPDIGYHAKLWDFDFACIDGIIENNKVNAYWTKQLNITKTENKYYDMHFFLDSVLRFFDVG